MKIASYIELQIASYLGIYDGKSCYKWINYDRHIHRDNDLPAIIYFDGTKIWYSNGNRHRNNDLPGYIVPQILNVWYQDGVEYRKYNLPTKIYYVETNTYIVIDDCDVKWLK
jgi:hypothetical protein